MRKKFFTNEFAVSNCQETSRPGHKKAQRSNLCYLHENASNSPLFLGLICSLACLARLAYLDRYHVGLTKASMAWKINISVINAMIAIPDNLARVSISALSIV